jgi:hypothetical protein
LRVLRVLRVLMGMGYDFNGGYLNYEIGLEIEL